jgi:uncharacterized protein
MQINVAQLLKEGTGATRSLDIDDVLTLSEASTDVEASTSVEAPAEGGGPTRVGEPAGGQESRVQGRASITRAERGILLKGSFGCQVRLTCVRCLTSFAHSAEFSVEEMFYPSIDILTGLPQALADEDGSACFTIDEHHILDTSEMIRQYCLLAIPMKALCRVDCAGLCPDCGANLNENRCHCVRRPRTALAQALEQAEVLDRAKASGGAEAPDRTKSRRKQG